MIDFFFSKGTWFYIASWNQNVYDMDIFDSGLSIIVFGFGIAWIDEPYNPRRREWCIPRNAWADK